MAGEQPLAQRLLERLDRLALRQLAARRRVGARPVAGAAYRLTRAAQFLQQGLSAREVCRGGRCEQGKEYEGR